MIYAMDMKMFPTEEQATEMIKYVDANDFEWRIARIENGFFIGYFGDDYFRDKYFSCNVTDDYHQLINNTGCIFIQNTDFECFCDYREMLLEGYTDDIWDTLKECFEERFLHDRGLLESEIVKRV